MANKHKWSLNTVSKKYSFGYILLAMVAVALLALSFACDHYLLQQYNGMTNDLLELNNLYIEVETVNITVNAGYLFLKNESFEDYQQESADIRQVIGRIRNGGKGNLSSREVVDILYTAQTYLEQSDQLIALLQRYVSSQSKMGAQYSEITQMYDSVQETMTYINLGFQDAYSSTLNLVRESQSQLAHLQQRAVWLQILLLVLGIMICAYYLAKVIKGITRSIRILTSRVKEIEKDVYSPGCVEVNSNDEFDDFASALNQMIGVIQTQLHTIRENANIHEKLSTAEIENLRMYNELQKSRLKLLQSRINPHFLFNILNIISSEARLENAEKSAEMMETTAAYLRYNLDNLDKKVTLEKEIISLKNYVDIQKYRFEDRYAYVFDIDQRCYGFEMPPMILQPLVENAIKHGLGMVLQGGCIWIRVALSDARVVIRVEDNGAGLNQERIDTLMDHIRRLNTESEHMGLRNIYMRLKYFYDDDVVFTIERTDGITSVAFSLPMKEQE